MKNPAIVAIDDNDSIVITRDGMVVGFVKIKIRDTFNGGEKVEMVANPVCSYGWNRTDEVFNDFATTMATNVPKIEDMEVENFIKYMNPVTV